MCPRTSPSASRANPGVPLRRSYSLYLGTSEETGMEDARYFTAHYPAPDLSIVPDTGFPVCCAQRGSMSQPKR